MPKFSTYPTPEHPFREVLATLTGKEPPAFVKGFGLVGLTDNQVMMLQDWCSDNARPVWATGLAMMEAAELIVAGAIENANILNAKDAAKALRENPPRPVKATTKTKSAKKAPKRVREASSRGTRIDGSTRIGE